MTAEDEIRNTLAKYCQRLNVLDAEGYISLFSKNCRMETAWGERVGREGIRDHVDYVKQRWPSNFRTRHTLGSSIIEVHGDTADAVSDVVVFHSMDNKPWIVGQSGQYIDKLILEDGEWLFLERRIEADTFFWPNEYIEALQGNPL